MPKVKPLGKPKKKLTKLEKAEITAQKIIANEKAADTAEKQRRFEQCVEMKLLKGHPQELAEKMAKEIIYNQQVV
tara:strand:- start:194 stop:418 length:225 start_codon:yes stop_codon:yes gene_type:complete